MIEIASLKPVSAATTRRGCVESAMRGESAGRTACFPLVDLVYASAYSKISMGRVQMQPQLHAQALARCARELPIDGLYVNLCLGAKQAAETTYQDGRYRARLDDCLEVEFTDHDVAAISRTEIRRLNDPRIESAELFHPGMLETFQAMPADVLGEVAVCVGLTGAFSQLGFLLGLENLMLAMVDQPEAVHRAIHARQEVVLRQAAELCRCGAKFLWIGEGMASSSLIGPAMYAEFVLPYEQELADEIRRGGSLSILHICGNITPSLPAIARSRADAIDVDAPTDWSKAVATLGPRMCLKGNLSPLLFLPENLARLPGECAASAAAAVSAKGFILSTGCLVPRDSAVEAFQIVAQACGISRERS